VRGAATFLISMMSTYLTLNLHINCW